MVKLYLLCGVQGSGKSTFAANHHQDLRAEIVSTDQIRKEARIDEKEVFPRAYEMVSSFLNRGINVIFDATNATVGAREHNLSSVKKLTAVPYETVCVYLKADRETCLERVKQRNLIDGELFLPLEVLERFLSIFEEPSLKEGFEEIRIIEQ